MKTKRFERTVATKIATIHGQFEMICYPNRDKFGARLPHFALVHGRVSKGVRILTRIQSECITGHVFQSLSCDCYGQLQDALSMIKKRKRGVVIYLRQEGRGIGLADKLRSYILQKQGFDTVDANLKLGHKVDPRRYDVAAHIIKDLNIHSIDLLSNNPKKHQELKVHGINIARVTALPPHVTPQNSVYLNTKSRRMGHTFRA